MEKVDKQIAEKQAWFDEHQSKQLQKKAYEDPVVFSDQIRQEADYLEKFCNPIVTRPKPAPKPPTPPPAEKKADAPAEEPAKEDGKKQTEAEMELD